MVACRCCVRTAAPSPAAVSTEQATTRSLADFFDGAWERIIATQPPAVRAHLDAERAIAGTLTGPYRALVEVGSADGSLLLPVARERGLAYLGLDLAAGAVAATRAAGGDAVRADVLDLAALPLPAGPPLVAFPFNVFGNLPEPERAIDAVAAVGADALVLTYDTGPRAAATRIEYYRACGLPGELTTDPTGVHFTSGPFTSSVYHPQVLTAWLSARGYAVTVHRYGTAGLAYHASTHP
jgi:hypothetical protein